MRKRYPQPDRVLPALKGLFCLLLCSLFLSGCGFKLRGAQPRSELIRALKRGLKASGVKLVDEAMHSAAVLSVLNEKRSKRIVSLDARGRAREYTLTYAVSFSVKARLQEFEIKQQTVQIDRDYVFDTEDVLGNSREEKRLYQEMGGDLVRLILLRLQSQAK